MRILCVATKCPWPPRDGGRLVLALTLQGLADAGHEIRVVAPASEAEISAAVVPENLTLHPVRTRPRGWISASLQAAASGCAATVVRHDLPAMRHAVAECLARWRPHVVHAEQLQAMAVCTPAAAAGVPVALRMHNVESALLEQAARARFPGAVLRMEARRLRDAERAAVHRAATTIALTAHDAEALAALARAEDRARIACIEPPFPAVESAGTVASGDPALALCGSSWWPNEQGRLWFLRDVWPLLHTELPNARLHVFCADAQAACAGVHWHAAPAQAQIAFPHGAIAVVPVLAAGGIRVRILEAWARGLPVIATSVAARGLDVVAGRDLLLADSREEFLDAVLRLSRDMSVQRSLTDGGRAYLRRHHDPARQIQALLAQYNSAMSA